MSLGSIFNPPNVPDIPQPPPADDPKEVFRDAVRRNSLRNTAGRQSLIIDPMTGISVQSALRTGGNAIPGQPTESPTISTQMFPR